jgi:hypothetical protein
LNSRDSSEQPHSTSTDPRLPNFASIAIQVPASDMADDRRLPQYEQHVRGMPR